MKVSKGRKVKLKPAWLSQQRLIDDTPRIGERGFTARNGVVQLSRVGLYGSNGCHQNSMVVIKCQSYMMASTLIPAIGITMHYIVEQRHGFGVRQRQRQ